MVQKFKYDLFHLYFIYRQRDSNLHWLYDFYRSGSGRKHFFTLINLRLQMCYCSECEHSISKVSKADALIYRSVTHWHALTKLSCEIERRISTFLIAAYLLEIISELISYCVSIIQHLPASEHGMDSQLSIYVCFYSYILSKLSSASPI